MTSTESTRSCLFRLLSAARRLGFARGMLRLAGRRELRIEAPLQLFSYEGCPACRRVRRALTELDLDYVHLSCPIGSERNRSELRLRGGKVQVPYLVDPNTGREMYDSQRIVAYLQEHYGTL